MDTAALNSLLAAELQAVNVYTLHAAKLANWGYGRLAEATLARYKTEAEHRQELIDRILLLGGEPVVIGPASVEIGEDVPEILSIDLRLELEAIDACRAAATDLRAAGDHGSAVLVEHILVEEEQHANDLQALIDQVQAMGLEMFLGSRA